MITIPLHIKNCSDTDFILGKQNNYSYAFRKLYRNFYKADDKRFMDWIQKKYLLTDIEYRSLLSDVKNKMEQTATNKSNQEERLSDIQWGMKKLLDEKRSNKNTRRKFKSHNKIKEIEDSLGRDITFGGKQMLRDLTRLHNSSAHIQEINKQKDLWKNNRLLQFYILGEANQMGNRFFDFRFEEHKIIYKPNRKKKIEISYSCGKKYQAQLLKLQELIKEKKIAITLSVSAKQLCLSFDNEILSGYYIDKQERRKEVEAIKKRELSQESKKELIKMVYKSYYEKLREYKLENKISTRYMAIDSNPEYIGYCIADKGRYGICNIIKKDVIDLTRLNEKLNLSSDHPNVIRQNNKRVFEINNVWKMLFEIAEQYKVAYFIKEDISEIGKNETFDCHEANRKIKNLWHRKISEWQIEKRCTALGIEIIKVNPVYSSFIGNLMYNYFDAVNAAIEICRRGMFKFEKGLFYPEVTGTISRTMSTLIESQKIQLKPRDAEIFKDCNTWNGLYKIAKNNGLRWRWGWEKIPKESYSAFSMNSTNSKVSLIAFN